MHTINQETRHSALLSDNEIIARVIDGQKGLYEIILRRHNRTLYRAVRSYLHDEADVQDAMQETYVKAYSKLHQYKADAAFSTWLVRIGINEALQHLRRLNRQRPHMVTDVDIELLQQLPDNANMNPEHSAIHGETGRLVEQAVDALPEAYRAVYMLREVEGMSNAETALALGLEENNVKVRLHRAKAFLKDVLWERLGEMQLFEFGDQRCDRLVAAVMARV